jgi:hypothetical protein
MYDDQQIKDPDSDCILWTGKVRSNGTIALPGKAKKNPRKEIFSSEFGEIEQGWSVLMKCRNRLCVNTEHMALSFSKGYISAYESEAARKKVYCAEKKSEMNRRSKEWHQKNKARVNAERNARRRAKTAINRIERTLI